MLWALVAEANGLDVLCGMYCVACTALDGEL
jgi:hypothetical protein